MRGIIIYAGKYGATEQYATWLGEALGLPIIKAERVSADILAKYDRVILGSSVYVGNLVIRNWMRRHSEVLLAKKPVLFVVSGSTTHNATVQRELINVNIEATLRDKLPVFFVPGRCRKSQLSFMDRIVLKLGAMMQKDPHAKKEMNEGFDHMDKNALEPLIAAFKR